MQLSAYCLKSNTPLIRLHQFFNVIKNNLSN